MMHSTFDTPSDIRSFASSNYDNKPVIVFVYMNGCPYCEMMKPAWNSFKRADTISTIDVNHELLNSLMTKDKSLFKPANSFPTIYSNYPNVQYEGDRSTNSFIEFSKTVKKEDKKNKEVNKTKKSKSEDKKEKKVKKEKKAKSEDKKDKKPKDKKDKKDKKK